MNRIPYSYNRFRFGNWPIRYKLLTGVLLAALLPLILALGFVGVRYFEAVGTARAAMTQEAQEGARALSEMLNRLIDTVQEETAEDTRLMTQVHVHLAARRNPGSYSSPQLIAAETNSRMQSTLNNNYNYTAMRLLDANGYLIADVGNTALTPSVRNTVQTDHPTYLEIIETLQSRAVPNLPVLAGPRADPQNQHLLFEVGVPVIENNAPVGYLIFTLDTAVVLDQPLGLIYSRLSMPVEMTRNIYLVDRAGYLLTSVYGKPALSRHLQVPLATLMETQSGGTMQYPVVRDGEPEWMLGSYAAIPGYDWIVMAELPLLPVIQPVIDLALSTILPLVVTVLLLAFGVLYIVDRQMVAPLLTLTRAAQQITEGNYHAQMPIRLQADEIGVLTTALSVMADNVRVSIEQLERRVRERTRDIEMTTIIGREASALRDVDTLLSSTVDLIVKNFKNIYHAQVFLIDETGQDAVLVASTGEPGRQLLARGHRLGVGSLSVIGRVTQAGQTVIARDTSTSPVHKKNEFLPNTRAEMALPLIRGTQVLGALDVQSTEPDAFTPEDQRTFETLAAQLAVAIDNARLFTETQRRTAEVENLNRLLMRTTWQTSLAAGRRRDTLVAAAGPQATDAPEEWSPWELEAIETGQLVVSPPQPDGSVTLALPIILRGERLGAVEWTLPAGGDSESTRQTAQELVARLGITLENVRLLEQTEQQAQRERLVNRISGRLMTQTSVNQILETAVRELAQVLGTPQVSIQLKRPNGAPASGSTENA